MAARLDTEPFIYSFARGGVVRSTILMPSELATMAKSIGNLGKRAAQ